MITTINEFKKYLESVTVHKYSHPKLINFGILQDMIISNCAGEKNVISADKFEACLKSHIAQLDGYWIHKLADLLTDNGWTITGELNADNVLENNVTPGRFTRAITFGNDFMKQHPEHKREVLGLFQLMKDEVEQDGSIEHEMDLFINACNDLLTVQED